MNSTSSSDGRILVLEPDEQLASAILDALHEVAPAAVIDRASSLEEAQRMASGTKPDLFVLDVDGTKDLGQEFLYDLRTSHPNGRAIILTAAHVTDARERIAGIGAIHLLEKPFPHGDFVDLVQALLRPSSRPEGEKFQGTLSDLHMADIIQLKCMSGATAAIEFTAPGGERGRIYFENGQVRHATASGKEGVDAFNEIVTWKGGSISEVPADSSSRTIEHEWQVLLMEAMRKVDEAQAAPLPPAPVMAASHKGKVLVIDDSLMLLSFVREILADANYQVATAPSAAESLALAKVDRPHLILLDYVLPDMKGDEVTRKLLEDPATARIPVVYMSGFGTDLRLDPVATPNVIGSLNKPFTSDLLIKTVENHMPKSPEESDPAPVQAEPASAEPEPVPQADLAPPPEAPPEAITQPVEQPQSLEQPLSPEPLQSLEEPVGGEVAAEKEEWWSAPPAPQESWPESSSFSETPVTDELPTTNFTPTVETTPGASEADLPNETVTGGAYFCGDTRFFSLNWAMQTIAKGKLTGSLRCFWSKEPIDLLTKNGEIVLATTRDSELYCSEAPITLVNVDQERVAEARAQQKENGGPLFITLSRGGHILPEPSLELVQHYGQRLFAQLWTAPRVRFVFEQSTDLPDYAREVATEGDVDHWSLATLRLVQFPDLGTQASYDQSSIPAYTRDGFERIQKLRLTVAEAQFASQFNGARSIQQIAKNLRLDLKFARLTLFRFIALEIVELWPATTAAKPDRKGVIQRLTRSIGIGD